jgi:hypothetical protein
MTADPDITDLLDRIEEVATPEQYQKIVLAVARILAVSLESLENQQ